jgi:hypothetical protein
MVKEKPRLTLLHGKKAMDADALAKLFEKLTGRSPTPQELVDAKRMLKSARRAHPSR